MESGRARIADFGLATVTQNVDSIQKASVPVGFTLQWTAPEVLLGEKRSTEADVYSFAMVMIEVRRGQFIICTENWLTAFHPNAGVHWCSSIHWFIIFHGFGRHQGGQASAAANRSNLHGRFMGVDATLLGSGP